MQVYKMRLKDRSQAKSAGYDYYRVGSKVEAYVTAKVLDYELQSVERVPDHEINTLDESAIEEVDAGWLIAGSPLIRMPVRTIACGVALGMVVVFLAFAILQLGWNG